MCDALAANTSPPLRTILANCLSHARRRYVDVVADFPEECRFVLETLREVYHNDSSLGSADCLPKIAWLFTRPKAPRT